MYFFKNNSSRPPPIIKALKLAQNIAIKGGTTEAALKQFEKNNKLNNIINEAVTSAYKRAIKLGK